MSQNKAIVIIDGYNVLRSSGLYDALDEADYSHDVFNKAREALIGDVALFAHKRFEATIVFDGAGNFFNRATHRDWWRGSDLLRGTKKRRRHDRGVGPARV